MTDYQAVFNRHLLFVFHAYLFLISCALTIPRRRQCTEWFTCGVVIILCTNAHDKRTQMKQIENYSGLFREIQKKT